jgi:ABC-type multidrug transport system fused ATPase/permease subunit
VIGYFLNKRKYVIGMDIKRRMFSQFVTLPMTYFDQHHSGDTIARINGDTELFLKSLDMVLNLTVNIITSVIMIPTMLVFDFRLGILAVIVGTLTAFINKKFRLPIRKHNEKIRGQVGEVVSEIVENISGFKVIKTYNLHDHFNEKFEQKQDDVIKTKKKNIKYNSFLYSSNNLIFQLNSSAVIIYGTYLIIMGTMTIGALVALRQLAVRVGYLLINTTEDISKVQDAFAGSDRVLEFLNQPKETENINLSGSDCDSLLCLEDIKFNKNS